MKVELKFITPDAANHIGGAAAQCYDGKTTREANIRRAVSCKDKGHLATLRFAHADFEISGISRICSHQIVRVAHAGILQQSQRYVEQTNIEYVLPPELHNMPEDFRSNWMHTLLACNDLYSAAIELGMKKEDARYILPQSCTTSLRMCMNFQAWRDFLKNRTDKAAQWEVREVANEIMRLLHEQCPELF